MSTPHFVMVPQYADPVCSAHGRPGRPDRVRMTPEDRAHTKIDAMLDAACWILQDQGELNLHAGSGVAVRDVPTPMGSVYYVLERLKLVVRSS